MKAIISKNYDRKNNKECFGVVIQVQKGSRYCKYPLGMQDFKTKEEASAKVTDINAAIFDGIAKIQYSVNGTKGINAAEYIKLIIEETK